MKNAEVEKSKVFILAEALEYASNAIVTKTVLNKITGNIVVVAFDSHEAKTEKISPFDTFIVILDGKSEIIIDDNTYSLSTGESIIIPAHANSTIKSDRRFKMLVTIIKSGYEE